MHLGCLQYVGAPGAKYLGKMYPSIFKDPFQSYSIRVPLAVQIIFNLLSDEKPQNIPYHHIKMCPLIRSHAGRTLCG